MKWRVLQYVLPVLICVGVNGHSAAAEFVPDIPGFQQAAAHLAGELRENRMHVRATIWSRNVIREGALGISTEVYAGEFLCVAALQAEQRNDLAALLETLEPREILRVPRPHDEWPPTRPQGFPIAGIINFYSFAPDSIAELRLSRPMGVYESGEAGEPNTVSASLDGHMVDLGPELSRWFEDLFPIVNFSTLEVYPPSSMPERLRLDAPPYSDPRCAEPNPR